MTARGAPVPGCPTSRCRMFSPRAARSLASRSISIAMKGGTAPRRATFSATVLLPLDDGETAAPRIAARLAAIGVVREALRAPERVDLTERAGPLHRVAALRESGDDPFRGAILVQHDVRRAAVVDALGAERIVEWPPAQGAVEEHGDQRAGARR